ncbi:TolC family protein [Photobacterium ganghwense]|uniref:TolC family protein n=1 Tax=Photobacterium ganghwense TaxID=320778 RepID=UPI0040575244
MSKHYLAQPLGMALMLMMLNQAYPALAHAASMPISSSPELQPYAQPDLTTLIQWAIDHDPGQQQFHYQADAISEMGIASSQLMDPKLKLGVGGLPVDSFAFDEDPMTNISVGLMQEFGRGDTLTLQQKQSEQQASGVRQQADIRKLDITKAVTNAWIELAYLNQTRTLMVQNQSLFRELLSYLETNYGLGTNQAQDIIQAELQISRIDEQLQANQQLQQRWRAQLSEWLGSQSASLVVTSYPQWQTLTQYLTTQPTNHVSTLASHPAVQVRDALIKTSETGVDIAREAYQPQFGVEVMYAYRQADRMDGSPAPDLVSAYLTMDLPLFTEKRQDKKLAAAQHQVGAARTQRDLLIQQMQAQAAATDADRSHIQQRLARYQRTLLKQAREKTRAVERGYQNNTSQLDEYIRAASDELALELEQARLEADLNQANNNLAYLLNQY